MRTLLVTGGAGFIGSAVVRLCIAETDYRVVTVDALTYAGSLSTLAPVLDNPRHRFEKADIRDAGSLDQIFSRHQPDAVLHLAAESHVDRSIDAPAEFMTTNVLGTFTLLEAARRHWGTRKEGQAGFRFHHVSTDEVFGSLEASGSFSEQSPYQPNSPYAASKAGADHLVRAWGKTYGLPVVITNCSNNFGPYQYPEKLIPLMITNALEGLPLPVYGDGLNVRDWLYVDDHARALLTVLERGRLFETYNVGTDNELTNLDLVRRLCTLLDRLKPRAGGGSYAAQITFVKDRPGHDRRYSIDATKLRRELGWKPVESFESALEKTVRWYVEHQDWKDTVGASRRPRQGLAA